MAALLRAVKGALLPRGARPRRLPFGLAAGAAMTIDFAHQSRIYFGLYERELAYHFRRLVRPGMSAYDVGANAGYYSLAFARWARAPVIAFDPDAGSLARIDADARRNGFDIRTRQVLIGDADGHGVATLDTESMSSFVPDMIKMDIEGAEAAALRGATRLLAERKPHLLIEVHGADREVECDAILRGHGYRPLRVQPRRAFAEERPDAGNGWLVCEGRAP